MIGRGALKASQVLALSVLTAGLVTAGFLTHPGLALAAGPAVQLARVVMFESNGTNTQQVTTAGTVGAFLEERGIVAGADDYVYPAPATPLSDRLFVEYRAAVPVTIAIKGGKIALASAAEDVGALLEEQHIVLGPDDVVQPSLSDRLVDGETIHVVRVTSWTSSKRQTFAAQTVHRIVFSMAPGTTKVLAKGRPGLRQTMVRYTQRDGGKIRAQVVSSNVLRHSIPRIVAEGGDEYDAITNLGRRELDKTSYVASAALQMVATAYTASCYGCSGITAIGRRAGHGVVAVDPRYIPLGSKLYIPGYGFAVAGDTGGAIVGNRIDLGFNSLADAVRFGRREITVYRLK